MQVVEVDPAQQPQLWELVLKSLRFEIFGGHIPPGTQLVESELADLFGVSRGPIREALIFLEQEHLIVREPRRGAFVRGITEDDVREIYGLRQVLETYAARLSCGRLPAADLERMQACIDQMVELRRNAKWKASAELDVEFHRIPLYASGHRRLLQSWDLLGGPLLALTATTAPHYPNLIAETHRGHREILAGYARGEFAAVREAIAVHVAKTQEVMLEIIELPIQLEAVARRKSA
jgi:DNA-binding GntR family transcriptional regulator